MTPHRIRWFILRGRRRDAAAAAVLYDGPDVGLAEAARASALRAGRYAGGGLEMTSTLRYAPPERNNFCVCGDSPARQMHCPFGHHTECHYPLTCAQAACRHLAEFGQRHDHPDLSALSPDERLSSWLAVSVRPDDRLFFDSPDEGDPACLCSRCGAVIAAGPVRLYDGGTRTERRYHPECLGMPAAADAAG